MYDSKSLAKRLADRAKSKAELTDRVRKIISRQAAARHNQRCLNTEASGGPLLESEQVRINTEGRVRFGSANLAFQCRTTEKTMVPQPWTVDLVNALLEAAEHKSTTLCLVWPAKLNSIPLLHALANLERQFASDLRGFRTLLFPATHACRSGLHSVLADKVQLSNLFRSLWSVHNGSTFELSSTSSQSFIALLGAVNDIRIQHPELPNPSLAELVPTFVFDPTKQEWITPVDSPLERTLSKVDRLVKRRILRQRVRSEWGIPNKAPAALMALHHSTKRGGWKSALKSSALINSGKPEVLLFDATGAAAKTNYSAVKRIPNYLRFARENGLSDSGSVIVTDDPKTFFVFRAQLNEVKLEFATKVLAVESKDVLLSVNPEEANWTPTLRSNSNFSISIVDRDASQLALKFQNLMAFAGDEDTPAYNALLQAVMYILRMSNMPAGYSDFTSASTDNEDYSYNNTRNAWTPVRLALLAELHSGVLNQARQSVEDAIKRTDKLIDDWNDATPLAARLLTEIKKQIRPGKRKISLVLPNNYYMSFARSFLKRKFGDSWAAVEPTLEWHTLSAVAKSLTIDCVSNHFVFLGINPDVIRVLLTHPKIPHGTAVLVAYRQAESTLKTLVSMKEVDEFKAYRGRIGLLAQELKRRLAEVPNPININKLREVSMTFQFDDTGQVCQSDDSSFHMFDLEGGRRTYISGWVYRYMPEQDPMFRRAAASTIQPGDFIFDMSDELRNKLESSLHLNKELTDPMVSPTRMLLKLYHDDVQRRCELFFKSSKRSVLAREIHTRMVEIDSHAKKCRPGRIYYWLALSLHNDSRPHAPRDARYFKIFCKALAISDDDAERHWGFVKNARRLNQSLGRELVARYAEILFQPESATVYRKISEEVLLDLQQDALQCVFRVEHVVPPTARTTKNKKELKSADS